MAKKPEKIVSFDTQTRNEYVKNVFTEVFVAGILVCVLRGILYFPTSFIADSLSSGGWQYYARTLLTALLGAIGVALPLYIYGLAVDSHLSSVFSAKTSVSASKLPIFYVFGTAAAVSAALLFIRVSMLLMEAMERSGYVFSVSAPDTGTDTAGKIFYIAVNALIPALICEPVYRGIVIRHTAKDSYALSVIVPALIFAANHPTVPQIPYMFVVGLILGWLYIKTDCIYLPMFCHAAVNAVIASLYIFGGDAPGLTALTNTAAVLAAAVLLLSAVILLVFCGFTKKHPDTDKPFSAKESFKAVFLTFGIYVLAFALIVQLGEWHIDNPDFEVPGMKEREEEYERQQAEKEAADKDITSPDISDVPQG